MKTATKTRSYFILFTIDGKFHRMDTIGFVNCLNVARIAEFAQLFAVDFMDSAILLGEYENHNN